MSRGNALIEILVIGIIVVLALLAVTRSASRLQAAGEEATDVARVAASLAARNGDIETASAVAASLMPGADVEVTGSNDEIRVDVHTRVALVGPEGGPLQVTVSGSAVAKISPFRSRNG
jgi:Flp pilus assembly protein TadG